MWGTKQKWQNKKNQNKCVSPNIFARSPFLVVQIRLLFFGVNQQVFLMRPLQCRMRAKVFMILFCQKNARNFLEKRQQYCLPYQKKIVPLDTLEIFKKWPLTELPIRAATILAKADSHLRIVPTVTNAQSSNYNSKKKKFCIRSEKVKICFQIVKLRTSHFSKSTIKLPKW